MKTEDKFHYSVLFTQVAKQEKLKLVLEKAFPKDRGKVFLPCMEWWRRGKNVKEVRPLFPGYVFIRSNMSIHEMHAFVSKHRNYVQTFVRELGLNERAASGEYDSETEEREYGLSDLTEEETRFLDLMLNEEGIVEMSEGYCDEGKYVVMKGPLTAFEEQIKGVDRHNRMAYLDFTFRGRVTKVGMGILPKSHWDSDNGKASAILEDGTEIDLWELSKRMMEKNEGV